MNILEIMITIRRRWGKYLIVNSNKETLPRYSHDSYQVIGGHLGDNEFYDECIVREVKDKEFEYL